MLTLWSVRAGFPAIMTGLLFPTQLSYFEALRKKGLLPNAVLFLKLATLNQGWLFLHCLYYIFTL